MDKDLIDSSPSAVVFGITKDLAPAVASVLMDLQRVGTAHNPDIFIFHDGIQAHQRKILQKIGEKQIIFVRYRAPISTKTKLVPSVRQFTPMVFSKFECIKLLDKYQTVLWLDCDIVIKKNVDELFQHSENDLIFVPGGRPVRAQFNYSILNYDLEKESMSSGLIVFNRNSLTFQDYEYCFEKTEEYSSYLVMPEQAIFDLLIQDRSLKCLQVSDSIYACHPKSEESSQAKIIHSYGQPKFWNGMYDEQWQANSQKWLEMGGKPLRNWQVMRKIKSKIAFLTNSLLFKLENQSDSH